jgi:pyruvate kinase
MTMKNRYKFPYLDEFDVIQATVTKLADDLSADGILALTSLENLLLKCQDIDQKLHFTFTHKKKDT